MEGFTGIKGLDKELMLNMGDREFIRTCGLNKYFQNICKDDYLFKRKLERFYPDVLKPEIYERFYLTSWKKYYADVVKTVAILKEKFKFDYTEGNPFFQLRVFQNTFLDRSMFPYENILYFGIQNSELSLVKHAIEKDAKMGRVQLIRAGELYDPKILKYLVEHGGNVNKLVEDDFNDFSPASKDYIKNLK